MANYTFGQAVRAARLGFYWCARLGCFLRISEQLPHGYGIELAPPYDLPPRTQGDHIVWWADDEDIVDASPFLRRLEASGKVIEARRTYVVGEDGDLTH